MKDKKHLYWVVGLVLITIILCGTLIWINHNSWTLRFEMDDNTKEAIQSIEFDKINQIESNKDIYQEKAIERWATWDSENTTGGSA